MLDVLWTIAQCLWQAFTWFFHAEERLAIILDNYHWPNWQQIPLLIAFNMLVIAWEIWLFTGFTKIFKINTKKPKTPGFILKLTGNKPIGIPELAILAFVPLFQKAGSFIYTTQRNFFGFKGYIALCIGGGLRLAIMAYLPHQSLWYIIIAMIIIRILSLWDANSYQRFRNGKNHSQTKE